MKRPPPNVNPWVLLAVAVIVQTLGTWLGNAPLFLVAHLHRVNGFTLSEAGALASSALVGGTLSLIAWGAIVDRIGEQRALTAGLLIASAAGLASAASSQAALLAASWLLVGVGTASLNSASGRLIVGWFPPDRRGTAMGIRQTALPLGVGMAAFAEPVLAQVHGLSVAMLVPALAGFVACGAVLLCVVDPPRAGVTDVGIARALANPYRGDRRLVRIHLASALLVVPQITVWTFIVVWLTDAKQWSVAAAGALAAGTQVLGAAGRIGAGWWSDRAGSRLRPIRTIAIAATGTMLLLGITEPTNWAIAAMVVATVITVADNGLAFTAVAEIGGSQWAGRAMGIQNTGQYLASALVPPLLGAVIANSGYAAAFGLAAAFPLLAIAVVPAGKNPGKPRGDSEVSAI